MLCISLAVPHDDSAVSIYSLGEHVERASLDNMMVLWPWQLAPPSNLDHAGRGRSPPLVPMLSRGHLGKERNRAKWPDSLPARLEHPLCSLSLSLSFFASRRATPRSSTTTLPKKEARTSAVQQAKLKKQTSLCGCVTLVS